jgi:hypothetical protein
MIETIVYKHYFGEKILNFLGFSRTIQAPCTLDEVK